MIRRYGREFSDDYDDLRIELCAIQNGGFGKNLFFHYKKCQQLLWPEEDENRWSLMILENILSNTFTILSGPKDSGKTHGMTKFALVDYFAFPENTLIIISSTDMRSLEGRIWGDLKAMWRRAKMRYSWLPGVIMEAKHCLCTDDLSKKHKGEFIVRDIRRGILCVRKGTQIDTPTGARRIEDIQKGDKVYNAVGIGTVTDTFQRCSPNLVRITLKDGRRLECTPEHLILTQRGWVKAILISTSDVVYSSYEIHQTQNSFLQRVLQEEMEWPIIRGKSQRSDQGRINSQRIVPEFNPTFQSAHRNRNKERKESLLRSGHRFPRLENSHRDRWQHSQDSTKARKRFPTNIDSFGTGVESVKILEQTSDKKSEPSSEGYTVYNLEVSGHPSYSANGVIIHNCVPCKRDTGGETDIASYVGMKQERRRYLADEFQFMSGAMFDSLANVNSGDFKMVAAGNPIGQDDPLDRISEPEGGWESLGEVTKTRTWKNKLFLNSKTVCLYGLDSPNFDPPETKKPRYWYLVNKESIERTIAGYGKDSEQYWSQCVGFRKAGLQARRVISMDICNKGDSFSEVIWDGSKAIVRIGAMDAAYGGVGGDRCVAGFIEMGYNNEGKQTLFIHAPTLVPVSVRKNESPEDQIAVWSKGYFERNGVVASNFFYDSTGRGSLGPAFARHWDSAIQPVEFGGKPTERSVRNTEFIFEKFGRRRLKKCNEHYSKLVTELWFSVRYAIEEGQIRGLPKDVAEEGCKRSWMFVAGNKIEVESKDDMKERTGRSPDLFDWLVIAVEGARRRGFTIGNSINLSSESKDDDWLRDWERDHVAIVRAHELIDV